MGDHTMVFYIVFCCLQYNTNYSLSRWLAMASPLAHKCGNQKTFYTSIPILSFMPETDGFLH
jgi:hypothetical protein